jgi:anhydro-N-acetylmuramic acid kinase
MMNKNLTALYAIAQRPVRRIIGLMSGTSMDGLDVALCAISGSGPETQVKIEHFTTVDYTDDIKAEIRQVFAKTTIDFQILTLLNSWIGTLHADMILACLRKWHVPVETVDLIASHGQTVMHAPKRLHGRERFSNATLQIGDGDHIAVKTGIITLSDFRQKHIAAGGEGAPLAVYGDYYIFSSHTENRIMLNMGGIANFTFLPASHDPNSVFVTDTGTGNTLIDAMTRRYFPDRAYDKDAAIARQGTVSKALLAALENHPFFEQTFPKTTGPELFNADYVQAAQSASNTTSLNPADVIATLTRFSADTIADAIERCSAQSGIAVKDFHIYISGGGMHNPLLTGWIKERLHCPFMPTDAIGISGDAKEAVLFAILANETICGNADFGTRKDVPSVSMGKISFPT